MKKFEEELNNGLVSIGQNIITKEYAYGKDALINYFKDWISPEDHQNTVASNKAYEKSNRTLSEENAKFVVENIELQKQIAEFKSQLKKQKPEIPEVPYLVADWLDKKPLYAINGSIPVEIIEWSQKQTGYADLGMNISHLLKLKVNGYTVAKEKRFYLKNKLTGFYLYKAFGGKYGEESDRYGNKDFGEDFQFTQQEIDSMETGSYEQIEVEE